MSIIQGPFSVAPCQTLISRFATFASPYHSCMETQQERALPLDAASMYAAQLETRVVLGSHLTRSSGRSSSPRAVADALAAGLSWGPQVRFSRYRYSPTGEFGYSGIRGAEG